MNITIVLRKRLKDPSVFDELVTKTRDALKDIAFDSITPSFDYHPNDREDGDVVFTSKEIPDAKAD